MFVITGRADNILNLAALMPQIETGEFNLTHPITFDPYTFEQYTLPAHMGGFTVSTQTGHSRSLLELELGTPGQRD